MACASDGPAPIERPTEIPSAVVRFDLQSYLGPLEGLAESVDAGRREILDSAWQALRSGTEVGRRRAVEAANGLLREDSSLAPAIYLDAVGEALAGNCEAALTRLDPVLDRMPEYAAAQMLAGRCLDDLQRIPEAFEAYREASLLSAMAGERADALFPRAQEIVARRVEDAIDRNELGRARLELARLEAWAPDALSTLVGARRVAEVAGEGQEELLLLRRLEKAGYEAEDLRRRRADLELDFGSTATSLDLYRILLSESEEDIDLADRYERAKFLWRTEQMPKDVLEIVDRPELSRADFSVLLYWLMPSVRYARTSEVRIANDILDHSRQKELARVINLGLIELDSRLHAFRPEASIRRFEVLRAVFKVLSRDEAPACLRQAPLGERPGATALCDAATRCSMVRENADCLPFSSISGRQATEWIRQAQRPVSQ